VSTFGDAEIVGIGSNEGVTNRRGGSLRTLDESRPDDNGSTEFESQQARARDAGPGDTIAFVEPDAVNPTLPSSHFLLHKVLITELHADQVATAASVTPADEDAPVQAPGGRFLVTFAVRAYDVERLVYAAEFGEIWLARDAEDADESGTRPQTRDTILEQIDLPLVLSTPEPATSKLSSSKDAGDEDSEGTDPATADDPGAPVPTSTPTEG